jgi:hypothetical protein
VTHIVFHRYLALADSPLNLSIENISDIHEYHVVFHALVAEYLLFLAGSLLISVDDDMHTAKEVSFRPVDLIKRLLFQVEVSFVIVTRKNSNGR